MADETEQFYALYLHGYAGVAERREYARDELLVLVLAAYDRTKGSTPRGPDHLLTMARRTFFMEPTPSASDALRAMSEKT